MHEHQTIFIKIIIVFVHVWVLIITLKPIIKKYYE